MKFLRAKSGGLINANAVAEIAVTKAGPIADMASGGGQVELFDIEHEIASLTPAATGWECITPGEDDAGKPCVYTSAIIAWALSLTGEILPVTAGDMDVPRESYALRGPGSPVIYEPQGATYDDEAAYLKHSSANR